MEIDLERVPEEPTVHGEAFVSLEQRELQLLEVVLVIISLAVGFLYGGVTGFILVLSPVYIRKRGYGVLAGMLLLVVLHEHRALALTALINAAYILIRTFGVTLPESAGRFMVLPYKVINVNVPIMLA